MGRSSIIIQLIQNSFGKMVKKLSKLSSATAPSSPLDEKESIFEEQEDLSTIPIKKEDQPSPLQTPPQSPSRKPIRKAHRNKQPFNPDGRFRDQHRQRFFLFPFHYAAKFPFCKISWEHWKPSGYFTLMAQFLSKIAEGVPDKTGEQCKSFDQRQKKEIYTDVDLLEAAFLELARSAPDGFTLEVLREYIRKMDRQSEYMAFLSDPNVLLKDILLTPRQCGMAKRQEMKEEAEEKKDKYDSIFNEFFDQKEEPQLPAGVF